MNDALTPPSHMRMSTFMRTHTGIVTQKKAFLHLMECCKPYWSNPKQYVWQIIMPASGTTKDHLSVSRETRGHKSWSSVRARLLPPYIRIWPGRSGLHVAEWPYLHSWCPLHIIPHPWYIWQNYSILTHMDPSNLTFRESPNIVYLWLS